MVFHFVLLHLQNEMKAVLDLGVSPDRIIYANPCKQISHIKYAAQRGVQLMTFDNEWELFKVKDHFPTAKYVILHVCCGRFLLHH